MKRLWLLGLVLVFVLTACGGQSPQPELPEEPPRQQVGEEEEEEEEDEGIDQHQQPDNGKL